MLSPSASPVPAYTQLELFATTYGTFGEASALSPENCTPMSCCSGRLRNGSRHWMAVGDAAQRRRLEPNLPEQRVRAEEPEMHTGVACLLDAVVHRLGPVLVMTT